MLDIRIDKWYIFTVAPLSNKINGILCGSGSGVEHHLAKVRSRSISSSAPQQSRSRLLFVIGLPYCYKTDIYHVNIAHLAAKIHIRFFGFPS